MKICLKTKQYKKLQILHFKCISTFKYRSCIMYFFLKQLWVISSPAFLVVVMSTFGVCSSVPPTPPTASAEEDSEPFKEGLKKVPNYENFV